jgi:hypothetical protein
MLIIARSGARRLCARTAASGRYAKPYIATPCAQWHEADRGGPYSGEASVASKSPHSCCARNNPMSESDRVIWTELMSAARATQTHDPRGSAEAEARAVPEAEYYVQLDGGQSAPTPRSGASVLRYLRIVLTCA